MGEIEFKPLGVRFDEHYKASYDTPDPTFQCRFGRHVIDIHGPLSENDVSSVWTNLSV